MRRAPINVFRHAPSTPRSFVFQDYDTTGGVGSASRTACRSSSMAALLPFSPEACSSLISPWASLRAFSSAAVFPWECWWNGV